MAASTIVASSAALAALGVSAAIVSGPSRARHAVAIAFVLAANAVPWFAPSAPPVVRALLAIAGVVALARVLDILHDLSAASWHRRVWHVAAGVDSRRITHAVPALDRTALMRASIAGAVGMASVLTIGAAHPPDRIASWALRWASGVVAVYALSECVYAAVRVVYRAIGLVPPPMHRDPAASRSVSEFWGGRWNLTVHTWLRANCYAPLARRGHPKLGVAAAFVASAALHAEMTAVSVGWAMAAWMAAFFLVQAALMLVERRIRVRAWQPVPRHLWTLTVLLASSPLFVEPFVRMLGYGY